MRELRLTAIGVAFVTVACLLGAAPVAAAPVLDLDIHHDPTHFVPGGTPGEIEVETVTQGSATVDEAQELRIFAGKGKFTLSFAGEETLPLPFNATGLEVRNALRALPAIGTPNVLVQLSAQGNRRTYTIEFKNGLGKTDVEQIVGQQVLAEPLQFVPERYGFDVRNVGDTNTTGTVTLALQLPPGLSRGAFAGGIFSLSNDWKAKNGGVGSVPWSCPGAPGDTTIVCTTPGPIPRHTLNDALTVSIEVEPGAAGTLNAAAEVSGGGAANVVTAIEPTEISATPDSFRVLPDSFRPDFFDLEPGGLKAVRRSGAHPDLLTVPFDIASVLNPGDGFERIPVGNIRDLSVDLPPGFLGNPTAVGECSQAAFTIGECPGSTQVGRIDAKVTGSLAPPVRIGIFNLLHPRGAVTDIALAVVGNPVHIKARLDPSNRYAITTDLVAINETFPVLHQQATFWGVPADSSHDSERCAMFRKNFPTAAEDNGDTAEECSTDHEPKPFLTVPSECGVEHQVRLRDYDSWQNPGAFGPDAIYTQPGVTQDCEVPTFKPEVSLTPTGRQANTPTGLDVAIHIPHNDNPNALATPPVRSTTVTLPRGMTLSPSFADGLEGCSETEFGISHSGVPDGEAVACPNASRIGEVEIFSPLLPKALVGSMYLAKQEANPFGSLFAVYLAAHDTEDRGILVKVAGELSLDPATGRITQTFENLPQLPFEDLTLRFRSGERAPLVNPPTCGTHTIEVEIASYAQPNDLIDASSTYQVEEGPGGAPCTGTDAARPFEPKLTGGTLNPLAGAFSPLLLRVTRTDADQEIATVEGSAPAGLSASLRGVVRCGTAQIAAAAARSAPGEGALERDHPSCPAASQVGTVQTGAGAGPTPIYVPGKIYLAGPYKGAPLSGVAVVPAIAGPVDLGTIVVRAPAYIDPRSAQIRIVSDPLPRIVHGVLVRVRDVQIELDRSHFTLNPTSCQEKSLRAKLTSAFGALASLAEHFQVGDCGRLGFRPSLWLKLRGGVRRGANPALRSVYRPRAGDANLERLVVRLPRSAFLDQAHIRTICTRVQFATDSCPRGAIYGRVRAFTPLLDEPLEGPVYLRSSSNDLPDLVFDLRGLVDFEAVARIDSVRGGIRAAFTSLPDAPIEKVVLNMQGGRKGLIVNSSNICKGHSRASARLNAHNGRLDTLRPKVRAQCGREPRVERSGHRRRSRGG